MIGEYSPSMTKMPSWCWCWWRLLYPHRKARDYTEMLTVLAEIA